MCSIEKLKAKGDMRELPWFFFFPFRPPGTTIVGLFKFSSPKPDQHLHYPQPCLPTATRTSISVHVRAQALVTKCSREDRVTHAHRQDRQLPFCILWWPVALLNCVSHYDCQSDSHRTILDHVDANHLQYIILLIDEPKSKSSPKPAALCVQSQGHGPTLGGEKYYQQIGFSDFFWEWYLLVLLLSLADTGLFNPSHSGSCPHHRCCIHPG